MQRFTKGFSQNSTIPTNFINTIQNAYINNNIQSRVNGKLTDNIDVNNGIRQGDRLGPWLLNMFMDEIIQKVRSGKGYKMGDQKITKQCYSDGVENKDHVQSNPQVFNNTCKQFNMVISTQKRKKLKFNIEIIEQICHLNT